MTARSVLTLVAFLAPTLLARAADPPAASAPVSTAELDRLAVEVLKDLHNRGADLYNAADAGGALRLYEGALRSVGPFLAHRPKVQAAIADGLTDAFKLDGAKAQAFRLHEVIDQVRNDLKAAMTAEARAAKTAPMADPKKPESAKPEPSKPESTKPEPPKAEPSAVGSLAGVLTLDGQPLANTDVTLVSLTLSRPQVFTAATDAAGKFTFPAELPAATYAVMVTGAGDKVPGKYQSTMTSGLQLVVKAGTQTGDVKLQSK